MLIRSQDKAELVNFNNATSISAIPKYGNKKSIVVKLIGEDRWTTLGCYTYEKALKVLDGIENTYVRFQQRYGSSTRHRDCIYVMPQEDEI
jgi:hypothetical protein